MLRNKLLERILRLSKILNRQESKAIADNRNYPAYKEGGSRRKGKTPPSGEVFFYMVYS